MGRWYGRSLEDRFWEKVDRSDRRGCWPWLAAKNAEGYGWFQLGPTAARAHKVAWMLEIGEIPDKHQIHHACGNRDCCNVAHMQLLTAAEHGKITAARLSERTSCSKGHEYAPGTFRIDGASRGRTYRRCVICETESHRKKRAQSPRHPVV